MGRRLGFVDPATATCRPSRVAFFGFLGIVFGAIVVWRWEGFANINRGSLPDTELFRSRRFWRSVYVLTGTAMMVSGLVVVVVALAQAR